MLVVYKYSQYITGKHIYCVLLMLFSAAVSVARLNGTNLAGPTHSFLVCQVSVFFLSLNGFYVRSFFTTDNFHSTLSVCVCVCDCAHNETERVKRINS